MLIRPGKCAYVCARARGRQAETDVNTESRVVLLSSSGFAFPELFCFFNRNVTADDYSGIAMNYRALPDNCICSVPVITPDLLEICLFTSYTNLQAHVHR